MALDDEEDNDLYGKAKPKSRVKCKSCGDPTLLGNATGPRAKVGLCVGCFATVARQSKSGPDRRAGGFTGPLAECEWKDGD